MVHHPIFQGEGVAIAQGYCQTCTDAPLFVCHADGAIVHRISIAVAGVQQVEYFFGKIQPALLVKVFGVVFANLYLKIALPLGDVAVVRLGCWRKIIRVVGALLVNVHMHLGHPFVVFNQALAGFDLGLPGPVAVEVKVVVVDSATGPGLLVLAGVGAHIGSSAHYVAVPMGITRVAVRVDARIDDDQGVVEPVFGGTVLGIDQFVDHFQATFSPRGFIAVYRITQPYDAEVVQTGIGIAFQQACPAQVVLADGFQFSQIGFGRNKGQLQRAFLIGIAVGLQDDVFAVGRYVLVVADLHFVGGKMFTPFVGQKLIGRL